MRILGEILKKKTPHLILMALAEINYSMRANERKPYSLSDVRLMFYPKSITFNHAKEGVYRLYLEKNVQVITEISEVIKIRTKNSTYIFANDTEAKPFRITNDKYCAYQVSLYQLQQNGEEIWKDSAEFTLNKFIRHYFDEFQRLDQQVKQKQKSSIAEHWRALSNNFTRKAYSNTVKFKLIDAILEFTCLPETDYDQIVRQDEVIRQRRKEKEQKFKNQATFTKSKTLPAMVLESGGSNNSKKYHENDSEIMRAPNQPIFIDEQTKREMTESLRKFSIKLPQNHKSPLETEASSSNQTISGLPTKSKLNTEKAYEKESQLGNQILINDSIEEQIENPDALEKDGDQSLQTKEAKLPIIQIKNFKSYENPEIYVLSARLGNLSLNSVMNASSKSDKKIESKSNAKQSILTFIWILLNILLIVYLMHPMPKF